MFVRNACGQQLLIRRSLQPQPQRLPLDLRMEARIVALDEEDIQLVHQALRLLFHSQPTSRDVELQVGALLHAGHFGGYCQFICIRRLPYSLLEAVLQSGRLFRVEVASTVAQREAALFADELDRDGMVMAICRLIRRKAQQIRGITVVHDLRKRGQQIPVSPDRAPPGGLCHLANGPLDGVNILQHLSLVTP